MGYTLDKASVFGASNKINYASQRGAPGVLYRLESLCENHSLSASQCVRVPRWLLLVLKHWTIGRTCEVSVGHKSQTPAQSFQPTLPGTPPPAADPLPDTQRVRSRIWSVSMLVLCPSPHHPLESCLQPLCPSTKSSCLCFVQCSPCWLFGMTDTRKSLPTPQLTPGC